MYIYIYIYRKKCFPNVTFTNISFKDKISVVNFYCRMYSCNYMITFLCF